MGFRINTNVMALTSNTMAAENNRNISSSLLSSAKQKCTKKSINTMQKCTSFAPNF
jgi:hypothetical protein